MSEYFSVKFIDQDLKNNRSILSGIEFGFLDKELVFEVTTLNIDEPLKLLFCAKIDKTKGSPEFEVRRINKNLLKTTFYNPTENSASGLDTPFGLMTINKEILGFMFYIDRIFDSKTFRITYQFYHGKLPPTEWAGQLIKREQCNFTPSCNK